MRSSELGELAAFAAIAREGNFRRAAAQLELKPSTLSSAMRALESRLGVRLLNRTTRSVSATTASRLFSSSASVAATGDMASPPFFLNVPPLAGLRKANIYISYLPIKVNTPPL